MMNPWIIQQIHKFHLKVMKLLMRKYLKRIVSLFSKQLEIIFIFLVAPIDGTIISYLISQVKLTFLISMKFSMIFQGSYIHGFNKNNITDIYSRTAFISWNACWFSCSSGWIRQVGLKTTKWNYKGIFFVVSPIIKHHVIVLFKLWNGIYPLFMLVEEVPCQKNHIIQYSEKYFNVFMTLAHRQMSVKLEMILKINFFL